VLNEWYSLHAQVIQTARCKQLWIIFDHFETATVSAYDRLFTNHDNLTNAWGAFWAEARNVHRCPQMSTDVHSDAECKSG
jgi:hypothetical protein